MTKSHDFHDKIAKLCFTYFDSLPKTGKPNEKEWTILSCIIQEDEGKLGVVALGTGSKCIGQDKMSPKGDILNDSHAEVMCRRSFIKYLLTSMNLTKKPSEKTIMRFDEDSKKFFINEDVKFHFFTTHVPCGDCAIFPKQNYEEFGMQLENDELNPEPEAKRLKSNNEDVYRTGAKCIADTPNQDQHSSGSNYHVLGVVRTKPGRGVKTLSVSCSDKFAKWCHLGIQGALLSLILSEPLYLSTFTIAGGTPFSKEAFRRGFYGRFGEAVSIKFPYKRQELLIEQSSIEFEFSKSEDKLPCPSSICHWTNPRLSKKTTEVAVEGRKQGVTRKQLLKDGGRLKLSKIEVFYDFMAIINDFDISVSGNTNKLSYGNVKSLAKQYREAWSSLKLNHFKIWPQKDKSLLDFTLK